MRKLTATIAALAASLTLASCSADDGGASDNGNALGGENNGNQAAEQSEPWLQVETDPEMGFFVPIPMDEWPERSRVFAENPMIANHTVLPYEADPEINQGLNSTLVDDPGMYVSILAPNLTQLIRDASFQSGVYIAAGSDHARDNPDSKQATHAIVRLASPEDATALAQGLSDEMANNGEIPIQKPPVPWQETPVDKLTGTRSFTVSPAPAMAGTPQEVLDQQTAFRTVTPIDEYVVITQTVSAEEDPAWREDYAERVLEQQRALIPQIPSIKTSAGAGAMDQWEDEPGDAGLSFVTYPQIFEAQISFSRSNPRGIVTHFEDSDELYKVLEDTGTEQITSWGSYLFSARDEAAAQELAEWFVKYYKDRGGKEYDEPQGIENTTCLEIEGIDGVEARCLMVYDNYVVLEGEDQQIYHEVNNLDPKEETSIQLATTWATFKIGEEYGFTPSSTAAEAEEGLNRYKDESGLNDEEGTEDTEGTGGTEGAGGTEGTGGANGAEEVVPEGENAQQQG